MDYDVLDVHHHVGDVTVGAAGGLATDTDPEEEVKQRLRIMDEAGVHQCLVIPGHGYTRSNGLADTRRINDKIAAYRDADPDRFPAAAGVVEPRAAEYALAEIDRCATELHLAAFSFHTRFQGVTINSPWVRRYVERMAEHGILPIIHALNETIEESLWKLADLARQVPDVTILALDAFESSESSQATFFTAQIAPNVVFDTSLAYSFDGIERFIKTFGAERVVFGTDLYSWPLGKRISHLLPRIIESSLSEDDKRAILGGNARRLLKVG